MGKLSTLYSCLLLFLFHSQSTLFLSSSASPLCRHDESSALLEFKNSFSISGTSFCKDSKTISSWENGTNCCRWRGVTCDEFTGHVIGLDVSCSGLEGTLLSNSSLFSLGHLQSLDLSSNEFDGSSISSQFGKLTHLTQLDLSSSGFSGHVPLEIAHLSKLVTLHLSSLRVEFETSTLKRIVQNLTQLRELDLSNNVYTSSLRADSFVNISSSLTFLDLGSIGLQGKLPENIFRLPNLRELYLRENHNLTGSFPKSNWTSPLKKLDLSLTEFSIDLAYLTSNVRSLDTLLLRDCKFIVSYPVLLGNFTHVTSLDLAENNFRGQFPWYSLSFKRIASLDLSGNNFVGELPENYGDLDKISSSNDSSKSQFLDNVPLHLTSLNLFDNMFNGTLPSWLYAIPSLEILDLHGNQFSGVVNEFQTRSLVSLDLHDNNLQGTIPKSVSRQINLTGLDLSSNKLSGVIEFNQFSELKNLWSLDLSFNNFSSSSSDSINFTLPTLENLLLSSCNLSQFPQFLKALENVRLLDLSHNQIQGSVPKWVEEVGTNSLYSLNISHNFLKDIELASWKSMVYLDLRSNMLHGKLPIPPPSTYLFFISNNQLSGELPSLICELTTIAVLDLSNNSFTGMIPPCLTNLTSLEVLDLSLNRFHGMIPSSFDNCGLRNLDLSGNQLEGAMPRSLVNCKILEVLDIGNNKINDTFPHWLETLPILTVLVLRSNKFHGPIGDPKFVGWLPFRYLRIIDLSHNEFSGPLPTKYFELMIAMMDSHTDTLEYMGKYFHKAGYYYDSVSVVLKGLSVDLVRIQSIFISIDFSENNFVGEIPKMIGNFKSLKGLNFSHNELTGSIPTSLANLTNLEWLDLSSNQLSGEIPQKLADLTSLQVLNLSQNHLVGAIPRGKQFNTFENDSYTGNLGLCGYPLSRGCENDSAQQPSGVNFTPEGDPVSAKLFDWKFALIGYGGGLVFGISMGYVVLSDARIDRLIGKYAGGRKRHKTGKRTKRNARLNAGIGRRNH
ncbi:Leucine-rich repeat domain containing protein [Trema orientale]|uniref:Leucine-rich repeat domain containing protein n=1 Tax=Trema orientale TaxID=63057 RepID=A0A2P5EP07_TREOI|nr:Leucine-rich repeat domain containing protein [Trema orientale]